LLAFIGLFKRFNSIITTAIEFLNSILTGLIISLFAKDLFDEEFFLDSSSNLENILLNNLPLILMSTVFLFVNLGIFIKRRSVNKSDEYKQLLDDIEAALQQKVLDNEPKASKDLKEILKDVKIPLPQQIATKDHKTLLFDQNDCKQVLDGVKTTLSNKLINKTPEMSILVSNSPDLIENFNTNYTPLIYLCLVFLHSLFAGLGFSGDRYFGWFEIIILLHKIFEVLRIKQALNALRCDKYKSFFWMFVFSFITSFGILLRGLLKTQNASLDTFQVTRICENIFIQSFTIITFVETFIPFPRSSVKIGLNWIIIFISTFAFLKYFSMNDMDLFFN
jgi:hypothetical protein